MEIVSMLEIWIVLIGHSMVRSEMVLRLAGGVDLMMLRLAGRVDLMMLHLWCMVRHWIMLWCRVEWQLAGMSL